MLGRSGVMVSPSCLGTMNFGGLTPEAEAYAIMYKAVEGGINVLIPPMCRLGDRLSRCALFETDTFPQDSRAQLWIISTVKARILA